MVLKLQLNFIDHYYYYDDNDDDDDDDDGENHHHQRHIVNMSEAVELLPPQIQTGEYNSGTYMRSRK